MYIADADGAFAESERRQIRMPTASGRMELLISVKMAASLRRFRHRFRHI